ncbi:MAG: GntR family transcriptional regulator [Alphaproteobacteria bacterium]
MSPSLKLSDLPASGGETLQEQVYQRLRRSIMIGEVRPGVALTIRGLAEALDVSPTPVREALRRLSAERALAVLDNRRVMVPEMTVQRFEELLALRVTLETHAAERALPYISDSLVSMLVSIDGLIDTALDNDDYEEVIVTNQAFHIRLYEANPHQQALPMVESLWLQFGPFLRLAALNLKEHYRFDRHKEAIEALRRRDPLALRVAIEADIRDGIGHIGRDGLLQAFVDAKGALR